MKTFFNQQCFKATSLSSSSESSWRWVKRGLTISSGLVIQSLGLAMLLFFSVASYAIDFSYTFNEDDPPSTIVNLSDYFITDPVGTFHDNNSNSTLLQVSRNGNCAEVFTLWIPYWCGNQVTVTLQPNQFGNATIETWGDAVLVSVIPLDGTVWLHVTVNPVNDPPNFSASNPPTVNEDFPTQTINNWATLTTIGAANEASQTVTYIISNVSNPTLFETAPTVANNGTLTYKSAPNIKGYSYFEVQVQDDGGTANGGIDISPPQKFLINVIGPEIQVIQNTYPSPIGGHDIFTGGPFDFGEVALDSQSPPYTFVIQNQGTADDLLVQAPVISGSSNFVVDASNLSPNPVIIGQFTYFTLTFQPTHLGPETATVNLESTDADERIYQLMVTGTGLPYKTLQMSLVGDGQGSVSVNDSTLTCTPLDPSPCPMRIINTPTWVYLTATPEISSNFMGWQGACGETGKVFIYEEMTSCEAVFALKQLTLTVEKNVPTAKITGDLIDCPDTCQATYQYGTPVQLQVAEVPTEWVFEGWSGSCDSQGHLEMTQEAVCRAKFGPDPGVPNGGDGNGDGELDARQPNVISLPDKVDGNYITFAVQPETCVISQIDTELPDSYGNYDKQKKPLPQGLIYFELACPEAQISLYYHAVSAVKRNFVFRKFGPTVPGNEETVDWYLLPNVTFEAVMIGGKSVVKASYTLKDGELGDSTGVDGRIVDPGGIMVK